MNSRSCAMHKPVRAGNFTGAEVQQFCRQRPPLAGLNWRVIGNARVAQGNTSAGEQALSTPRNLSNRLTLNRAHGQSALCLGNMLIAV